MKEEPFLNKIDRLKQNILKKIHDLEKFDSEIKELKSEKVLDQKILNKFEIEKQYNSTSQMRQRIKQYNNKIKKLEEKKKMNKEFLDNIKLKLNKLLEDSQEQSKV